MFQKMLPWLMLGFLLGMGKCLCDLRDTVAAQAARLADVENKLNEYQQTIAAFE